MQDDEGPVIADPVTTAMAVFDQFHDVSSTMIELTDGARVPVLDAMSRTLFLSLDRRDKAISDVHTLAPPVPEEDAAAASVGAKAAQDEEAATFDLTMPGAHAVARRRAAAHRRPAVRRDRSAAGRRAGS